MSCATRPASGQPHALYDPSTGGVTLTGANGQIGFTVWGVGTTLDPLQRTDLHGQSKTSEGFSGVSTSDFNSYASWANFDDGFTGDLFAGDLFEPGTPYTDIAFEYLPGFGYQVTTGNVCVAGIGTDLLCHMNDRPAPGTDPNAGGGDPGGGDTGGGSAGGGDTGGGDYTGDPRILIDPSNGEVTIQGHQGLIGLAIRSEARLLLGENATDLQGDAPLIDIALAPEAIAWSNFGGFQLNEAFAGQLVSPDWALPFSNDITFEYVAGFGQQVRTGQVAYVPEVAIPEPSTACLLAILCFGLTPLRVGRFSNS